MRRILLQFMLILLPLLPVVVFAQAQQPDSPLFSNPTGRPEISIPNPVDTFGDSSNLNSFFTFIVSHLTLWAGIVAFFFALYGGIKYITAGGNPQNMEAGKRILIGSIVGIFIIMLAYLIVHEVIATTNCVLSSAASCHPT